jgi:hypothetical protein
MNSHTALHVGIALLMASVSFHAVAQNEPAAPPKMKMITDIPSSLVTPGTVETRIGTLRFTDGFPDEATVAKVYDNLDFLRGQQAYLTALPAVSVEAFRRGFADFGPVNQTVLISEQLLDAKSLFLTANTTTPYSIVYLDTKGGPLVLEVPPEILGPIDDPGSVGFPMLALRDRAVPEGYFAVRSRTFGNLMFPRV